MTEFASSSINFVDVSQLKDTHPELVQEPKVLIDGWSKTLDDANNSLSEKHDAAILQFPSDTLSQANRFIHDFTDALRRSADAVPLLVAAGNSAGVQKSIVGNAEQHSAAVAYGLPKGAESYVQSTEAPVLIYPPRPGNESRPRDWGSELSGEFGLASTDFNIKLVVLVGGGPNLFDQLSIYLENQQKARANGNVYRIIAIQGVGGSSSKDQIISKLGEEASTNIEYYDYNQAQELVEEIKSLKK